MEISSGYGEPGKYRTLPGPVIIHNGYVIRYPDTQVGYVGETFRTRSSGFTKVKVGERKVFFVDNKVIK
jgi:hypothetical protein